MHEADEELVWFAMRATYRRELQAKEILEQENMGVFIPMRYRVVQKGKVKRRILAPVISQLVFVHATPTEVQRVKQKIPFLQYMMERKTGKKITVPERQMQQFISVAGSYDDHLLYFKPEEINIEKGSWVRIHGGEFDGLEGTFVKVKGARDRRVVIKIQGVVAVALATIHPDLIEVLPSPHDKA